GRRTELVAFVIVGNGINSPPNRQSPKTTCRFRRAAGESESSRNVLRRRNRNRATGSAIFRARQSSTVLEIGPGSPVPRFGLLAAIGVSSFECLERCIPLAQTVDRVESVKSLGSRKSCFGGTQGGCVQSPRAFPVLRRRRSATPPGICEN